MKHNTESNTLDHSNLINKLDNFRNAWAELNEAWLENDVEVSPTLETDYPFDSCFNELNAEVSIWTTQAINAAVRQIFSDYIGDKSN
tara:strand:- start:3653 stop:3913 length:261 start_codon:yes stop_codon:yes gene_type:complete